MRIPRAVAGLLFTAIAAAGLTTVIAGHATEPTELALGEFYLVWLGADSHPFIGILIADQIVQAIGKDGF